ncbi:helix-turn-helix domain-containing protein [Formosa sp. A9]|uniref:helix-turn-helix domain-containing protein n=1 Tax=Formosa sp. A9 TaxID=3442641 RepID=UPI003EBC2EF4
MNTSEAHFPRIMLLELMSLNDFPIDFQKHYHTHLLCHSGHLSFLFNGTKMNCKKGEFLFWFADSNLSHLKFSKDFKSSVLLVEKQFLDENVPDQNLSIDAILHSRQYPVKQLNEKSDYDRILTNFLLLHSKYQDKEHRFYDEALKLQMRLFILEMWHTFTKEYERRKRSLQSGTLYEQFMHLVQLHCLKEREVQFYANQLHISAKYLNFVCKKNSDITASQWIQRYAKERIILLLENKRLNIAEIADEMDFSSRSFFTRYVKKILGVTPSAYRNRLD